MAFPTGLVIWNTLGSLAEIQASGFGVNGFVSGTVTYGAGYFDNAAYTGTSRSNKIIFNDGTTLLTDNDTFCLEYWGKPNFACVNGVSPGDHNTWALHETSAFTVMSDYISFNNNSYWASGSTTLRMNTLNFSAGTYQHFAFVKNRNGINGGSDTMRVYVDGTLQWSTTTALSDYNNTMKSLTLGSYYQGGTGANGAEVYFDNVKFWDYDKVDFSDRFTEGFGASFNRKRIFAGGF